MAKQINLNPDLVDKSLRKSQLQRALEEEKRLKEIMNTKTGKDEVIDIKRKS